MSSLALRFHCPQCHASIKAPHQLSGQRRNCPGCSHSFLVPRRLHEDAGPVLVPVEKEDRFVLGVRYQTGTGALGAGTRASARYSA
jgi:hypothetical protein